MTPATFGSDGLTASITQVERAEGNTVPWIDSLDPVNLVALTKVLYNAC